MASALYRESFVLYESVFRMYQRIYKKDKAKAADYINAVMEFGIDGVLPDEDDELWFYGLDNAIASIDSSKNNRTKNIEDGAKGGRKKIDLDNDSLLEMKNRGMSYQQIADELGVSKSTIQRRFNYINNSLVSNGVKCQNLNVNDNGNDNENDNVNENENENENEKQLIFPSEKSATLEDSKMSNVKYIFNKPIEEEQATAAKIQKQINDSNREQWLEQLYYGVDFEELNNAKTFEERKKALGF